MEQEITDELKSLASKIIRMIQAGDPAVPEELSCMYRNMKPGEFAFWLHGYVCGRAKNKELTTSGIFRFLSRQVQ